MTSTARQLHNILSKPLHASLIVGVLTFLWLWIQYKRDKTCSLNMSFILRNAVFATIATGMVVYYATANKHLDDIDIDVRPMD